MGRMANVTVSVRLDEIRQWREAAARQHMTLKQWLIEAARLAIARGSTR